MRSKIQSDLAKVEKREKTFSTLAKEEGKGAVKRAKKEAKEGLKESAKDSKWEAQVDKVFSKLRQKKATAYHKMKEAMKK